MNMKPTEPSRLFAMLANIYSSKLTPVVIILGIVVVFFLFTQSESEAERSSRTTKTDEALSAQVTHVKLKRKKRKHCHDSNDDNLIDVNEEKDEATLEAKTENPNENKPSLNKSLQQGGSEQSYLVMKDDQFETEDELVLIQQSEQVGANNNDDNDNEEISSSKVERISRPYFDEFIVEEDDDEAKVVSSLSCIQEIDEDAVQEVIFLADVHLEGSSSTSKQSDTFDSICQIDCLVCQNKLSDEKAENNSLVIETMSRDDVKLEDNQSRVQLNCIVTDVAPFDLDHETNPSQKNQCQTNFASDSISEVDEIKGEEHSSSCNDRFDYESLKREQLDASIDRTAFCNHFEKSEINETSIQTDQVPYDIENSRDLLKTDQTGQAPLDLENSEGSIKTSQNAEASFDNAIKGLHSSHESNQDNLPTTNPRTTDDFTVQCDLREEMLTQKSVVDDPALEELTINGPQDELFIHADQAHSEQKPVENAAKPMEIVDLAKVGHNGNQMEPEPNSKNSFNQSVSENLLIDKVEILNKKPSSTLDTVDHEAERFPFQNNELLSNQCLSENENTKTDSFSLTNDDRNLTNDRFPINRSGENEAIEQLIDKLNDEMFQNEINIQFDSNELTKQLNILNSADDKPSSAAKKTILSVSSSKSSYENDFEYDQNSIAAESDVTHEPQSSVSKSSTRSDSFTCGSVGELQIDEKQIVAFLTQNQFESRIDNPDFGQMSSINGEIASGISKTSEIVDDAQTSENSLLKIYQAMHLNAITDHFRSLHEVSKAIREAGLEKSQLIFGIDFTISNLDTGEKTFDGRSLHHYDPNIKNPYQKVIEIVGKTLEIFDADGKIPAFGFGDSTTKDSKVFPFSEKGYCCGFTEVLECYNKIVGHVELSGPTNFAPLIKEAIKIIKNTKEYHILVIVADGQVTNARQTREAIVEASKYPLSIIMVGVGDGPWDKMEEFDDSLPIRQFDNFQFVNYHKAIQNCENPDEKFALNALMEIPDQFKAIKTLGLLDFEIF